MSTFVVNPSNFDMQDITQDIGGSLSQVEQDMNNSIQQIANSPSPSPTDLVMFQAQMTVWSTLVQTESETFKVYSDTMKAVVNNIGS